MKRTFYSTFLPLTLVGLFSVVGSGICYGQAAGSRGGLTGKQHIDVKPLEPQVVENYITVEGKVEMPLVPNKLRAVLALVTESENAAECQKQMDAMEEQLKAALAKLKLKDEAIVMDFINVLPLYKWVIEEQAGQQLAVEKSSGFRMQTNAHIEVNSDEELRKMLQSAFQIGITDVIGIDYATDALDEAKTIAQGKALQVAQNKAKVMLEVIYGEFPRPINFQEETRVIYPHVKYQSFEQTRSQQLRMSYNSRQQLPTIEAAKPLNTYYSGFTEQSDVVGEQLPMKPTISVVATVRLYYAVPGEKAK